MYTTLKEIEKEYSKKVRNTLDNGCELNAELLVELSISLFSELKIKNISDSEYKTDDMLLYQYGYDWGDEFGKHFSLDITRQFTESNQDEPYQLGFKLIYESEHFQNIDPYSCWSIDVGTDINNFVTKIKATDGFKMAVKNIPKTYQIRFDQC